MPALLTKPGKSIRAIGKIPLTESRLAEEQKTLATNFATVRHGLLRWRRNIPNVGATLEIVIFLFFLLGRDTNYARLHPIAPHWGLCWSRSVHIEGKSPIRTLLGIPNKVHIGDLY